MKITIEMIPHAEQRYDTCGDWWFDDIGNLEVRISDLGNEKMEALVGVHEAIEALLCQARGIDQDEVTSFDRIMLLLPQDTEPGDAPDSPYRREHFFATTIERLLAAEFGVDWTEYDRKVSEL